jgi:glycosyltransferase involved in cell wall biosynthesis
MKKSNLRNIIITSSLFVLFLIFTILTKFINVAAIGPENSKIGFAELNNVAVQRPNFGAYIESGSNVEYTFPFNKYYIDPTIGKSKRLVLDEEYNAANLFVLPTHSENFGSVVIEALARKLPVICSQGAPWKELEDNKCGWWPEDSVSGLRSALVSAMGLSEFERTEMGMRGKKLVEERYTWCAVCNTMFKGYKEIVDA